MLQFALVQIIFQMPFDIAMYHLRSIVGYDLSNDDDEMMNADFTLSN